MKRVTVTSLKGRIITNGVDFIDPTAWIARQESIGAFGPPGQYTVQIVDVSTEYKQQDLDKYTASQMAQCESSVEALLSPKLQVTHLMECMYQMYIALNVPGTFLITDIAAAKTNLANYVILMNQIQQLRATRDANIAAYKTSIGL